jgi:hypothetical protein
MGENFTGVKNQKLTRLAAVLAAVVVVASAADLALVQPRELEAQLAGKGARPVIFMVGPNVLYRSKHPERCMPDQEMASLVWRC